jgi:arginyl-tRNA synthetase
MRMTALDEYHLLDGVFSCLAALDLADKVSVEVRRSPQPVRDLTLFCNAPAAEVAALAAALVQCPDISEVGAGGRKISVRFRDEAVLRAGEAIEHGSLPLAGTRAPRIIFVGFLGPNLSKALHVGHLRNIVLGNACAAMLRAAGHKVCAYSLVGDIGRNVCEAMAGWRLLDAEQRADLAGLKSDQRIGFCYRAYLDSSADRREAPPSEPCHRELVPVADDADRLLQLWRARDPDTIALWRRICADVERGHDETLHRLGIRVDRAWRESDHVDAACALVERGLAQGHCVRDATGMTFHETGLEQYPKLVLARADGFPTEHARVIAIFDRVLGDAGPCDHIDWNGTEWEPAQRAMALLMKALGLGDAASVHRPEFHGMVIVDGAELSSSRGDPPLVDHLLDRLVQSPEIGRIAGPCEGRVDRADLAALVLKSYFLCAAPTKPLDFSWRRLMQVEANPGWTIARAWARAAMAAEADQEKEPAAGYRTSVLQAASLRRDIEFAATNVRLTGITSFLVKFSERLVTEPACPRLDRLAKTAMKSSLSTLGLLPLPADRDL